MPPPHPHTILAHLPKLPMMADAAEIAYDEQCTTKQVDAAIRKLRDEGLRIESWPGHDGMRYGVSVVSWEKSKKLARQG